MGHVGDGSTSVKRSSSRCASRPAANATAGTRSTATLRRSMSEEGPHQASERAELGGRGRQTVPDSSMGSPGADRWSGTTRPVRQSPSWRSSSPMSGAGANVAPRLDRAGRVGRRAIELGVAVVIMRRRCHSSRADVEPVLLDAVVDTAVAGRLATQAPATLVDLVHACRSGHRCGSVSRHARQPGHPASQHGDVGRPTSSSHAGKCRGAARYIGVTFPFRHLRDGGLEALPL